MQLLKLERPREELELEEATEKFTNFLIRATRAWDAAGENGDFMIEGCSTLSHLCAAIMRNERRKLKGD